MESYSVVRKIRLMLKSTRVKNKIEKDMSKSCFNALIFIQKPFQQRIQGVPKAYQPQKGPEVYGTPSKLIFVPKNLL